jgi:hypothetical protein
MLPPHPDYLDTRRRQTMGRTNSTMMSHVAVMILAGVLPLAGAGGGRRQERGAPAAGRSRETGPPLLCTARIIYVHVRTNYMNGEALERELLKRPELRRWGMAVTRKKEEAELIIEVTRKRYTTRFSISVVDADTDLVIASDSASSIGGTVEPKLAARFVRQVKAACREG